MKIYVPRYSGGAGRSIYRGYSNAWASLGYDVLEYDNLSTLTPEGAYYIMAVDGAITKASLPAILEAEKAFVFAQPTHFPKHWGTHPNFVSTCPSDVRVAIAGAGVTLWTFSNTKYSFEYYKNWGGRDKETIPKYIPLAFDNTHYKPIPSFTEYDVCFIGGRANNGFNEKIKILELFLQPLIHRGITGIFVEQQLDDSTEIKVLSNAKIALNLHDAYQQELGFDTNERTFKALGLTGYLVSDYVTEIERLELPASLYKCPEPFLQKIESALATNLLPDKQGNRDFILANHTYSHRVQQLLNNEDFNYSTLL